MGPEQQQQHQQQQQRQARGGEPGQAAAVPSKLTAEVHGLELRLRNIYTGRGRG